MQDVFNIFDLEELLVKFIASKGLTFTQGGQNSTPAVYRGAQNLETQGENGEFAKIQAPCIIAICQSAPPLGPEFCGNWEPSVEVQCLTDSSDATSNDHRANWRKVLRVLLTDTLAADLTAFSKGSFYSARAIFEAPGQTWTVDGNCWSSSLHFTLRQACAGEIHKT